MKERALDGTKSINRPYLSIDEIAERWGVSRSTVYNLIADRKMRAKRFGRHIRVHCQEIHRFEEQSDWENGQYRVSPMKGKKMPRRGPKATSEEAAQES